MFENEYDDVQLPDCEIMLARVGSDKYNAHFIRIMMCGMSVV